MSVRGMLTYPKSVNAAMILQPFDNRVPSRETHLGGGNGSPRSLDAAWYALRTKTNHEFKVYDQLIGKGFDSYLPSIEVASRRRDRKKTLQKALFPGYMFFFTALSYETQLEALKSAGAIYIVSVDNVPAKIPESEIDSIKLILESKEEYMSWPFLKENDPIQVVAGPLKGAVGSYVRRSNKRNLLVVSMELIQRSIAVEIEAWMIEKG